jgi:hypothetical protein
MYYKHIKGPIITFYAMPIFIDRDAYDYDCPGPMKTLTRPWEHAIYIYIYKRMCVCMFKINSLTPKPIPTKFGVATIQNPATNIGYN